MTDRYIWPLPELSDGRRAQVTSHHRTSNRSRPKHNGCDLFYRVLPSDPDWPRGDGQATSNGRWVVPPGTPAIAVCTGRVLLARRTSTGSTVWVQHKDEQGNLLNERSGYFHLSELLVTPGQDVAQGRWLGVVGDNPSDKDARHLHFEWSTVRTYNPVDPWPFLKGASHMPIGDTLYRDDGGAVLDQIEDASNVSSLWRDLRSAFSWARKKWFW